MKPINEHLYNALVRKFGKVHVSSEGVEARYQVIEDLASWSDPHSPKRINIINWGETYAVNCLKCRDKRARLYISHIWGTRCDKANRRIHSCIKCHNESCSWGDLWDFLFDKDYSSREVNVDSLKTGVDVETRRMELPGAVDDLIPINMLPAGHPVVQYLQARGFRDINMLAADYQFCYCAKSPWKKAVTDSSGKEHFITPEHRLIIPNTQNGVWHGWMARFIGDIPKDPKTGKPVVQKYLNAPGYSFGSTLYRLEEAKKFSNGEFCIICEGALSAIACGAAGVCTFGMFPKPMQEELLAKHFPTGKLIFMVESEAAANKRIYECIARLTQRVSGGCLAVEFTSGQDPATVPSQELVQMIKVGVNKAQENKCPQM